MGTLLLISASVLIPLYILTDLKGVLEFIFYMYLFILGLSLPFMLILG